MLQPADRVVQPEQERGGPLARHPTVTPDGSLPQLVAAARQPGDLGGVARQIDGLVVGRA